MRRFANEFVLFKQKRIGFRMSYIRVIPLKLNKAMECSQLLCLDPQESFLRWFATVFSVTNTLYHLKAVMVYFLSLFNGHYADVIG